MASSKEYVDFILEQCDGLSARAMMGEYVLYYREKVFGGIYDNRVLVKPTLSALSRMPDASLELPYEGTKEMLLLDSIPFPKDKVQSEKIKYLPTAPVFSEAIRRIYEEVSISNLFD